MPRPRFVHGTYSFKGKGYDARYPLDDKARYTVSPDKRAELVYMRGANSSDAMICVILTRDGEPMRYFPLGARASHHVPLAVIEAIFPASKLELLVAAPEGLEGMVILDFGLLEEE